MAKKFLNKNRLTIQTIIFIIIDQITKNIFFYKFNDNTIKILGNFFKFSLHLNEGIAFSIPINGIMVPIIVMAIITLILIKYGENHIENNIESSIIISLIYAGGISNLIDRFIHNAVIDFISISNFPIFNLADTYITASALLILINQDKILKKI